MYVTGHGVMVKATMSEYGGTMHTDTHTGDTTHNGDTISRNTIEDTIGKSNYNGYRRPIK